MFGTKQEQHELVQAVRDLRSELAAVKSQVCLAQAELGRMKIELFRTRIEANGVKDDGPQAVAEARRVVNRLQQMERECVASEKKLRVAAAGG